MSFIQEIKKMITVAIEKITPAKAKAMLEMNTGNFRKPNGHRVERYAKEMLAGQWHNNGDTIKFNGSVLIDGQHRLLAIMKSGVSIDTIVVRGLDSDGRTVDRGMPRTVSQWCQHNKIKNATNVAAAARLCVMHARGAWHYESCSASLIVDSELFQFIELNQERLQQCVSMAGMCKPLLSQSLMAAVLFNGCDGDPRECVEAVWFCEGLANGEMLSDTDSVLHLRNRLVGQTPQNRLSDIHKRAFVTIAWNKMVNGDSCTASGIRLRLTGPAKQELPTALLKVGSQQ